MDSQSILFMDEALPSACLLGAQSRLAVPVSVHHSVSYRHWRCAPPGQLCCWQGPWQPRALTSRPFLPPPPAPAQRHLQGGASLQGVLPPRMPVQGASAGIHAAASWRPYKLPGLKEPSSAACADSHLSRFICILQASCSLQCSVLKTGGGAFLNDTFRLQFCGGRREQSAYKQACSWL